MQKKKKLKCHFSFLCKISPLDHESRLISSPNLSKFNTSSMAFQCTSLNTSLVLIFLFFFPLFWFSFSHFLFFHFDTIWKIFFDLKCWNTVTNFAHIAPISDFDWCDGLCLETLPLCCENLFIIFFLCSIFFICDRKSSFQDAPDLCYMFIKHLYNDINAYCCIKYAMLDHNTTASPQ